MECTTSNHRTQRPRTGAAAVESAFVLPIVLFLVFALLDLGLAALRYNTLADAALCIAREAAIHGELASSVNSPWGPDTYTGSAADSADIVTSVRQRLPTMLPELVSVEVTWPDKTNLPRDRVQVALGYQHEPILPGLFPWGTLNLRATSVVRIVN